jgi:hypothetical protein
MTGLFALRRQQAARVTVCLGHSATLHFHGKTPPHFFALVKMLRIFLYRAQKNVRYNWNVMCNTPKIFEK